MILMNFSDSDEATSCWRKIIGYIMIGGYNHNNGAYLINIHVLKCSVVRCGVWWCGVVWCGVVWCGVVWCGVVWCGVVWCVCGVVWCGVVWCGVVWCGVWCGVVWCGVVWWCGVCGVVCGWCGVVYCFKNDFSGNKNSELIFKKSPSKVTLNIIVEDWHVDCPCILYNINARFELTWPCYDHFYGCIL